MKRAARNQPLVDLPKSLALFPLSGCILLPRAVLPLQVFEPRYVAMLDAALAGTRLIGIIQPAADASTVESPEGNAVPLRQIGCAGRITSYQELDDGRYAIAMTGICRFKTNAEVMDGRPFRTFDVDFSTFEDDLTPATKPDIDRPKLLSTLSEFLAARKLEANWQAIEKASSEALVNALSIMSPFSPEEKQALLEAADLKTRAETLCTLALMDLAGGGRDVSGRLQ